MIQNTAYILKVLTGVTFMFPIMVGIVYSFMPSRVLYSLPTWNEYWEQVSFSNYTWVFNNIPVFRYILNTFIVCAIVIVCQIVFSSLAAYAFANFEFKGKVLLFTLIQVAMMIPGEVTIITNYMQVYSWGLIDTYLGLSITSMIAGTSVFMMRQTFLSQVRDIKEAAVLDGCGEMRYFFKMAMPLARPTIVSLVLMRFIGIYNAYFWPLLVTNKDTMRTIQVGMARLVGTDMPEYGLILAGAVLCIIPSVIVFILGQDYLVKGMSDGAVKG